MQKQIVESLSFLLYLLPLALLTGPFIPDLFVTLIGIIGLFLIIKNKEFVYFKSSFFIIFTIFYIYITLRSIFAINNLLSLESSLFYFRFGLFSISVWFLINNNKKLTRNFSLALLITFIIVLIDGYYQYFNEANLFGFSYPGVRLTLTLDEKPILGGYLARLFPFLLALLIYNFKLKKINFIFLLSILIITDVLIFVSGERTALGLLFLSTVFIMIFISKYKKIRFFTFLSSIVIMALLASVNSSIKERNIDRTMNQITGPDNQSINIFSSRHQSHLIGAWNMFLDNPLFGQGPKMFRELCDNEEFIYNEDTCSSHPHNTYAQLLAEIGIIGLIFPTIFLFYIFKIMFSHMITIFKKNKYLISDYQICLLACFLVSLWPLIPTLNFFNNWISVIYYLPVGFFLHSLYSEKNE